MVNRNIKLIRERLETARRDQQPQQQQGQPHRPNRRSGVVDDTVPGKYRTSQNMEGAGVSIGESIEQQPNQGGGTLSAQDVANNYSLAEQVTDPDIAALYAKVQKPPKGNLIIQKSIECEGIYYTHRIPHAIMVTTNIHPPKINDFSYPYMCSTLSTFKTLVKI